MEITFNLIKKYFPHIDSQTETQFSKLQELYETWNSKINVISRKDIDKLYLHHVLHSLAIAKFIRFKPDTTILDLGTGGGFPGIPLAILFPQCNFHLIDGTSKKIKVVKEIVAALKLENVKVDQLRAEECKNKYDFVLNRAVASIEKLWMWSKPLIRRKGINGMPNGMISLKGGQLEEELILLEKEYLEMQSISDLFEEAYFLNKYIVYVQR